MPQPATNVQVPLRSMPSAMPLCSPSPLVLPTAMHSDVEGHDTFENESPSSNPGLLPLSPDHVVPPFVVDMTKDTLTGQFGNGLQSLDGNGPAPTATQVVVEGQEIPKASSESAGMFSAVQFAPPFVVVTTAAVSSAEGAAAPLHAPTALHAVVEGHEIPVSCTRPGGRLWSVQLMPPFVVAAITGRLLGAPVPTTVHVVAEGHEIASICPMPAGAVSVVQFVPPLVVTMTSPDSTAVQSLVVAQEIALSPPGVGA